VQAHKISFAPISRNLFVRFFRKFLRINYPPFRCSRTSVNPVWIFLPVFRFLGVWPQAVNLSRDWPRYVLGPVKMQRHVNYLSAPCHRYADIRPQQIRFQKIWGRITPKPEIRLEVYHHWINDAEFYESCKFGNVSISQTRTVTRWKSPIWFPFLQ